MEHTVSSRCGHEKILPAVQNLFFLTLNRVQKVDSTSGRKEEGWVCVTVVDTKSFF